MGDSPGAEGSGSARTPLLRRLLRVLLLAELIYLVVIHVALQPWAAQRWISEGAKKVDVEWGSGFSVVPGLFHVRDLHVAGEGGKNRWDLRLDTLRVWIVAPELVYRQLTFDGLRASGLEFRLERLEAAAPDQSAERSPRSLAITVRDLRVDGVRELWIDSQGYRGDGWVSGDLLVDRERGITVPEAHLELAPGRMMVGAAGEDPEEGGLLENLRATVEIERFVPHEHRGTRALRFVSGTVSWDLEEGDIGALGYLFREVPWLDLGGTGALQLAAEIKRGRLLPGSKVHAWARSATRFLDYGIHGQARVRGAVEDSENSSLEVEFDAFEVLRDGYDKPFASGSGASLVARGSGVDLVKPAADWTADLDLPAAEVPDLTYYNAYLPPSSSIALLSGSGTVRADFHLDLAAGNLEGEAEVKGKGIQAAVDAVRLRGDLAVHTRVRGDAASRRFDLAGSKLRLEGVSLATGGKAPVGSGNWWGELRWRKGTVGLEPLSADGELDLDLRSSEPLVRLLESSGKPPRWLREVLTLEGVKGEARLTYRDEAVDLGGVDLRVGKRLNFLGEIHLSRERPHLLIFCRYGRLTLALEQVGEEREWKPIKSLAWYEGRRRAWRGEGAEGGSTEPENTRGRKRGSGADG